MGLHWAPSTNPRPDRAADLDALCLLLAADDRVMEVVHPGCTRSADGSVIHTGDSRTGASHWDDERIFVFLEALPDAVCKVAFVVWSATGKSFDAVAGARCHVSDRISDLPWLRVDLTALRGQTVHTVAILCRDAVGWRFASDAVLDRDRLSAELALLSRSGK